MYSLNNPVRYTDPSGKFPWLIFFLGAAVHGGMNARGDNGEFDIGKFASHALIGGLTATLGYYMGPYLAKHLGGTLGYGLTGGIASTLNTGGSILLGGSSLTSNKSKVLLSISFAAGFAGGIAAYNISSSYGGKEAGKEFIKDAIAIEADVISTPLLIPFDSLHEDVFKDGRCIERESLSGKCLQWEE